jgi:hypothetical protein
MTDQSSQTAWVEGVSGHGTGQRLYFEFEEPTVVSGIEFINGYAKSHSAFKNNSRVETIVVSDSAQNWQRLSLRDTTDWQSFPRDQYAPVQWIMFEIQSVFPGEKWSDTAITEIRLR